MGFNAQEYINSFSRKGESVKDLQRIYRLLEKLDFPYKGIPFVHIAGTNGKGSVLEYMSEVLIKSGYKTGRFTSPYVEVYNDRIRINSNNIPQDRLEDICKRVKEKADSRDYSQFEITLAIAFIYFKEENCDIVFLEAGIGGLIDATNVIESPLLSVITSVSLDHTGILGDTVEEIACQKAGIIKKSRPVVLSRDNTRETAEIVKNKALSSKSEVFIPDMNSCKIISSDITGSHFIYKGEEYSITMGGKHQIYNALTAIEGIEVLKTQGFKICQKALKEGLLTAKVKLRTEILSKSPLVICDGGHNIAGIDSLYKVIKEENMPVIGLVGMVLGKPAKYFGEKFSNIFDVVYLTDGFIDGSIPAKELQSFFTCKTCPLSFKAAVNEAVLTAENKKSILLICGSLYLASAARKEFYRLKR